MNPLSAYSAYTRTASIGTGPSYTQRPIIEQPVKQAPTAVPIADDAIEFIPARIQADHIDRQDYREQNGNWHTLPKSVQTFVSTEYQDGDNRIGRFLDIHA